MDGEIFMRSIACFGDIVRRSNDSDNQFRGDSLEGFSLSFENNHNPYAYVQDTEGNLSEIVPNQIGLIDVSKYREKIFCMYSLEYDEDRKRFITPDARISLFGDTAVIIHNPGDFYSAFVRKCFDDSGMIFGLRSEESITIFNFQRINHTMSSVNLPRIRGKRNFASHWI